MTAMKPFVPIPGWFVAAAALFAWNTGFAAERCVFPNDPSVLDVKRDFGAKGDGVADDTAALQAGIAASCIRGKDGGTKILYLPNGTYRVTSNLVVNPRVGPWVYGESRDGVVIRLADGVSTNVTAVLRTHPSDTKASSADFFMRNFRHLTIDVGRNPHADGIRWYGNNSSILRDVRVIGTGKVGINAGFLGQNGPSLVQDAIVEGAFETGARCAWSWGQTLSRVTVRGANQEGVAVNATAVGIEDLVVENTPVALRNEYPNDWKWWGGVVALAGGRFSGGDPAQPAITNSSVLYARDVQAKGFKQILVSTTPGSNVVGDTLSEYLSHPATKLFPETPSTALKLPVKPEPRVPWETNLSNWVCANEHGAKFGDNRDDTEAIQRAIDAAAAERKTVVYLRGIGGGDPNWYNLNGEVRVHGSVRFIIGLGFGRVIGGDNGRFIIDDRSAPVVKFLHLQAFGGRPPAAENRSATNTLVVESCDLRIVGNGGGDIFVTDCPSRVELRSPGQRLWARQLNPEGDSDTGLVQNHGGRFWALGVKHEGRGVRWLTDSGGQTEILGLFNYAPSIAKEDPRPAFDVVDADFSAAGVREISFGNTYPVKARERRGEETRTDKGGGWIGWALFRGGTKSPAMLSATQGNTTFPLTVTLSGALFLREAPIPDSPTLVLDVTRTGDRWERVWGFAGDFHINSPHPGRVVAGAIADGHISLTLEMGIQSGSWAKGGRAKYQVNLKQVAGETYDGTYNGEFRGVPVSGRATATLTAQRMAPLAGLVPPQPGEHPRLLFRKSDLPALREKAKTPLGEAALAKMGSSNQKESDVVGLGMKYQLTGDRQFADQAIQGVE